MIPAHSVTKASKTAAVIDDGDLDDDSPTAPARQRLPDTRASRTGRAEINGLDFYITVGFYDSEDPEKTRPAELFVKSNKHGSDMSLMLDGFATMVSVALQYGVPWKDIHKKFRHTLGSTQSQQYSGFLDLIVQVADGLIAEHRDERRG